MRNTNIEILRFVLMVAIFVWHTIVLGLGFVDGQQGMYEYSGNTPLMFLLCSLLAPATYCFVFVSGYYGIKFSVSKLLNLLLWLVIVALSCSVYRYLHGETTWYELYSAFLPLVHNRWWFITAFVALFIVAPFVNIGINYLSKTQIVGILLVLYGILIYRWVMMASNAGSSFLGILFVYMLARFMAINKNSISRRKAVLLFCLSALIVTLGATVLFYGLQGRMNSIYAQRIVFQIYAYCNPLIILMAITLFYFVLSFEPRTIRWINFLLKTNLFVYLFTQGVGLVSYKDMAEMMCNHLIRYAGVTSIIVVGALLVGHVIAFVSAWMVRGVEFLLRKLNLSKTFLLEL